MEEAPKSIADEATELLRQLMGIKRLCAEVHAVMHEVKVPSKRPGGKARTRREPTGDQIVRLFEGGMLPVAIESDEAVSRQVNSELGAILHSALESERSLLRSEATKAQSVAALKRLQQTLACLRGAEQMKLLRTGKPFLVPNPATDTSGIVVFTGADAAERAQKLCITINRFLASKTAAAEKHIRDRLAQVLTQL